MPAPTVTDILKGSDYALTIFTEQEVKALKLFDKGGKPYLTCAASDRARQYRAMLPSHLPLARSERGRHLAQSGGPGKNAARALGANEPSNGAAAFIMI
jgi:hypothetical protein